MRGKAPGGAAGLRGCTPELNTPIVQTRGSAPSVIERKPPHDWPMTATCFVSILPFSGEPAREFSLSAQSTAAVRSAAVARGPGGPAAGPPAGGAGGVAAAPGGRVVVMTRNPCEAIVVRNPAYRAFSMAHPPFPHTTTGSLSCLGNESRFAGRNVLRPVVPKAGSEVTAYGPATALGAPSSGRAV